MYTTSCLTVDLAHFLKASHLCRSFFVLFPDALCHILRLSNHPAIISENEMID
jgi:hypothetical protein